MEAAINEVHSDVINESCHTLFSSNIAWFGRLLMKCQLGSNQREDAIKTGTASLQLARKHVPQQLIPICKQMVCMSMTVCVDLCSVTVTNLSIGY